MAFQQNQGFSNNNNTGDKKKSNFRIGNVQTQDGKLNMTVWKSDRGGIYLVLSIASAAGKDPTTGRIMYEQKMPNELPTVFMNRDAAYAFLTAINQQKSTESPTMSFTMKPGRDGSITIAPDNGNIKITIENSKTTPRTMTLESIPVGNMRIVPGLGVMQKILAKAVDKMLYDKFDPDEFNLASSTNDDEEPF